VVAQRDFDLTRLMNPVPQKPVVEVIRSELTSDGAVEGVLAFLRSIGKEGVLVGDAPGFVTNRILMAVVNSAVRLAEEGVASPQARTSCGRSRPYVLQSPSGAPLSSSRPSESRSQRSTLISARNRSSWLTTTNAPS
jgi:hypothetical protein